MNGMKKLSKSISKLSDLFLKEWIDQKLAKGDIIMAAYPQLQNIKRPLESLSLKQTVQLDDTIEAICDYFSCRNLVNVTCLNEPPDQQMNDLIIGSLSDLADLRRHNLSRFAEYRPRSNLESLLINAYRRSVDDKREQKLSNHLTTIGPTIKWESPNLAWELRLMRDDNFCDPKLRQTKVKYLRNCDAVFTDEFRERVCRRFPLFYGQCDLKERWFGEAYWRNWNSILDCGDWIDCKVDTINNKVDYFVAFSAINLEKQCMKDVCDCGMAISVDSHRSRTDLPNPDPPNPLRYAGKAAILLTHDLDRHRLEFKSIYPLDDGYAVDWDTEDEPSLSALCHKYITEMGDWQRLDLAAGFIVTDDMRRFLEDRQPNGASSVAHA